MADSGLIDWEQMDMIADGYPPEFMEILREFVAEMPPMFEAMSGHGVCGDLEKVGKVAHQIKGSAANFGFRGVSSLAAEIEALAKAGSSDGLNSLTDRTKNDFCLSLDEIREKRGMQI